MATTTEALIDNFAIFVINPIIMLLFAFATLYFIWGLVEFIRDSDSDEAREKGKIHMIYGVIGLFIMGGAFGFLCVIAKTINVSLVSWC